MTYGKLLSDEIRDSIRKRFSDIKFDGITKWYPLPENLVLPYNHNSVTFDFIAIETGRNFLVRYQYILEGYDKEWSPITEKTSATFGNIYEGAYIFKLKARSPEGVWSKIIEYKFKVLPPWWRTWWMYSVYGILAIAIVVLVVWLNSRRLIAQKKILEHKVTIATKQIREEKEKVEEQKKVVEERNKIVEEQKKVVEQKNNDILDSIHYAQRIQEALLTTEEYIKQYLPDWFIIYRPRDIVSGDFYWALEKGGYFYFVTADCTGHGVSGAFMSLLGISLLNEIIIERGIAEPGEILNVLRHEIIHRLNPDLSAGGTAKTGGKKEIDDGMDMILMRFRLPVTGSALTLSYASANRFLWVWRNGELLQFSGDMMPVGAGYEAAVPFTGKEITLQESDIVYTFTDGIHDQFGGAKGKKLGKKGLQELLLSVGGFPVAQQKIKLEEWLGSWMKNSEQIDDICLVGIKVR